MNELFVHTRDYISKSKYPSLDGLWFYLINRTEGDIKSGDLKVALFLLQKWYEDREEYERCHTLQLIIKEHEATYSNNIQHNRSKR